jgi:outer membrane protein assembly factor BamB
VKSRFAVLILLVAGLVAPGLDAISAHASLGISSSPHANLSDTQGTPNPGPDPTEAVALLWSIPGNDGEIDIQEIADGKIFYSSDDYLHAIDAATGEQLWIIQSDYLNRFEIVDGTIYATSLADSSGTVYAIDAATGQMRWTFPVDGDYFYPTIAGDLVYIEAHGAGQLYAVDAATGALQWSVSGGWWLVDDVFYVGSDGMIFAIEGATGQQLWTAPADRESHFDVDSDLVYISERDSGRLSTLDTATGQLSWTASIGGRASLKGVTDDVVYVRGQDGDLFAIDKASGQQRWVAPVDVDESGDYSIRIVDDMVYIQHGHLYAIDATTGQQLWTSTIGGDYNSTRFVDGTIYTIHSDRTIPGSAATVTSEEAANTLSALDQATGQEQWTVPIGRGFSHIEEIVDDLVYATDGDDTLYAIDAASGDQRWNLPANYPTNLDFLADGIAYVASGDSISAIDIISGQPYWSFSASEIIDWPLDVADGAVIFATEDGTLYTLGNPAASAAKIEATATAAAASAESTAAAAMLEDAWSTYLSTDLAGAFTANVAALPGMNVISFDIGINVDTAAIPEGYDRIIAFPVAISGGASATWTVLAIFPSADDASAAMANMSGGLLRSGWQSQEVDSLDHDHACLSLSTADSSQAICYMARDDTLLISHSTVPVPAPDAAVMNVVDLTNAMNDAYDEVDRPD